MEKTIQIAKINDGANKITVSKKDGKYIVFRHWTEWNATDENGPAIRKNHKKKIGEYTEMKSLLYDLYRTW